MMNRIVNIAYTFIHRDVDEIYLEDLPVWADRYNMSVGEYHYFTALVLQFGNIPLTPIFVQAN